MKKLHYRLQLVTVTLKFYILIFLLFIILFADMIIKIIKKLHLTVDNRNKRIICDLLP